MKKKLHTLLIGCLLAFGPAFSQTNQVLTVASGYNQDVIANGVGTAASSSTIGVDNANYAFLSADYQTTASSATYATALPVTGLITSAVNSAISFQLAPYTGNNALRLQLTSDTGTLTFSNQVSATKLYVLATGGSGAVTFSTVITFTDGTVQSATGSVVPDWYNSTSLPVVASGFGRISRNDNVVQTESGNPRMYMFTVDIAVENQAKLVSSMQFTKTSTAEGSLNVFGVSALGIPLCPVITSAAATATSSTAGIISWVLGAVGTSGTAATYTLEVYTDALYTTPIAGSPFTGLTVTSQSLTGLTFGTPYYYRVKASNGVCDSPYVTGIFTPAYCTPTSSFATSYYINNFSTATGYTNIANATGSGAYNNYSTMVVSKAAGTSFTYSGTRSSTLAIAAVYVDWNQDLDFSDDGETIATFANGATAFSGTIAIPAGTAIGNYRMRVRSTYYFNTTLTPCGALTYGEAEDYTIGVVTTPAPCTVPDAPAVALSSVTATGLTVTVTAAATAPTAYIVVRSTAATLSSEPVTGTTYTTGTALGGGTVIATGATIAPITEFVNPNTHYYYFVYAYNDGGATCLGPVYSTPATANATTCTVATNAIGASNITGTSANINWTSVSGSGGSTVTYTVEVYSDLLLTTLLNTYTTANSSYALTGLTAGTTYYYRVKAETTSCSDATWSTASFTAQNGYTPIDITSGFDSDVIANGNGLAASSTTASVDSGNFAYLSQDYKPNATAVYTFGLPANRVVNSATTGLNFILQDYSGNNSLRLAAQNSSGTLAFATPVALTNLYLAVTSGSGGAGITAQIMFSDGTSQTTSQITLINWDSAATVAIPALVNGINLGRVDRSLATGIPGTGNFKVFQVSIAIDAANQSKPITGVLITKTGTGTVDPVANIFAVSGQATNLCTTPAAPTATAQAFCNTATIAQLTASGAVAGGTYKWYATATSTTPLATTATVSTGLYFVSQIVDTCESARIPVSVTVSVTPQPEAPSTQTVCPGTTVAELQATGADNGIITWTANGTVVTPDAVVEPGTLIVTQTIGDCVSAPKEITIIINVTPSPAANAEQTFCAGATVANLDATTAEGATVHWYFSGFILQPVALTDTLISGMYAVTQTVNGCVSASTYIQVTVNDAVEQLVVADQAFCGSATTADVTVGATTGATVHWFNAAGDAIVAGATLTAGTYTVSQSIGDCTSTTTEFDITINAIPTAPVALDQEFCGITTTADVVVGITTGATAHWYDADGDAVAAGVELTTGTYTVTQSVGTCESTTTEVSITVNAIPNAPVAAATQDYVAGETVADLEVTYANADAISIWYIMNDAMEYVVIEPTTVLTDGTTYYVTQSTTGCESNYTPITVNEVLGTGNFAFKNLSVYPNPAATVITIANQEVISQIVVTNLLGQTVINQTANTTTTQVDVSALAAGSYILQVYAAGGSTAVKVIKQ